MFWIVAGILDKKCMFADREKYTFKSNSESKLKPPLIVISFDILIIRILNFSTAPWKIRVYLGMKIQRYNLPKKCWIYKTP